MPCPLPQPPAAAFRGMPSHTLYAIRHPHDIILEEKPGLYAHSLTIMNKKYSKPHNSRQKPSQQIVNLSIRLTREQLFNGNLTLVIDLANNTATAHTPTQPSPQLATTLVSEFHSYAHTYSRKDRRMVLAAAKHFDSYISRLSTDDTSPDTDPNAIASGFLSYLYDSLNGNTPANYFKKFREFLDTMLAKGIVTENAARNLSLKYYDYRVKSILTLSDIHRLETTPCRSDGLKRAFLFACCSGLRWSDIYNLRWDDIDMDNRTMTVRQQKVREHSRAAVLHTYLNTSAMRYLDLSHRPDPRPSSSVAAAAPQPVFVLPSYTMAYRLLQTWASDAGISKHISFHCARHTFVSRLVAAGVDIKTVADLAGHSTTRHTERYVHQDERHLRESISRIEI